MKWFRRTDDLRWARERLDGFVDGELSPGERERFVETLAVHPSLQAEVDLTRVAKQAIAALPALRAPRSFVLTPEAVAARSATPLPVRASRPALLRLAQAGSGLAAAVFVLTLGASLVGTTASDGDDDSAPASLAAEAPAERSAASSEPGGAAGQAVPAAAATKASEFMQDSSAPPPDTAGNMAATAAAGAGGQGALEFDDSAGEDGGTDATTVLLVLSGGLAIALGATSVGLRMRTRRDDDDD